MVRIIKATELPAAPAPRPDARFVDVSHDVDCRLQRAREEADRILDEARQQAEQIRCRAEQLGRGQGQAAFDAQVRDEVQRQLATVLPALQQAVEVVQSARSNHLSACETGVIRLAAAIAQRLVRRELRQNPDIPLVLIREALELATGSHQITIHLHPGDYNTLRDRVAELTRLPGDGVAIEVLADPEVSPGGCLVHTEFGTIDQRFESQLSRMIEELT